MRRYVIITGKIMAGCMVVFCVAGCAKKEAVLFETNGKSAVQEQTSAENSGYGEEGQNDQESEDKQRLIAESTAQKETEKPSEPQVIYVHITGAVKTPGVYSFRSGARVYEALEQAGGLVPEAEESYVNQAAELSDGEMIYIPTKEEAAALPEERAAQEHAQGQDSEAEEGGKIDINQAGKEDLMRLNGIGETRAEQIIAYREENGNFQKTEDIMQVEGIKEGTYQKIQENICVN